MDGASDPHQRASTLLQSGLTRVGSGELEAARDDFKASAELAPTADAYTYWGWMEHKLGNTEAAIALCHQAIALDPEFGNPYNDIGSYLVAQGKLEDAIPWFEKAIAARRYEPRQFPHMNLARVYLTRRDIPKALAHFEKALGFAPESAELQTAVAKLRGLLRKVN